MADHKKDKGGDKGEKKPKKGLTKSWEKYEKGGEGLKRKNTTCPKCGPSVFMANHKDRKVCGKCGYAEMSSKKE